MKKTTKKTDDMDTFILLLILCLLAGSVGYIIWQRHSQTGSASGRDTDAVPHTTVNVAAGAVVKIRHASDSIELQVSGPEPYLGPLSDAADSIQAWDALRSGKATPGQRRTIIEQLEASGLHVTEKGEDKAQSVSRDERLPSPESPAVPTSPAYDEEPEGSLVEAPVGASTSLEDLKALVIRGLKEHLCTPAFARLAAREYGFNMEFQDPEMQRESLDEEELRKVEAYREAIRKDVSEAMRLFGEDHPARSQVNGEEQRRAPERIPKMKAPDYDFSRLK